MSDLVELARSSEIELHLEHVRLDLVAAAAVHRVSKHTTGVSFRDHLSPCTVTGEEDARVIEGLRGSLGRDAETIDRLQEETVEADRIERAQRALIRELRGEVGDAALLAESIGERLRAAELELVDLRAIRDALLEPALVQREGMTIAAEVIPAARYVCDDFFFVGDGPSGTTGHGNRRCRRPRIAGCPPVCLHPDRVCVCSPV